MSSFVVKSTKVKRSLWYELSLFLGIKQVFAETLDRISSRSKAVEPAGKSRSPCGRCGARPAWRGHSRRLPARSCCSTRAARKPRAPRRPRAPRAGPESTAPQPPPHHTGGRKLGSPPGPGKRSPATRLRQGFSGLELSSGSSDRGRRADHGLRMRIRDRRKCDAGRSRSRPAARRIGSELQPLSGAKRARWT